MKTERIILASLLAGILQFGTQAKIEDSYELYVSPVNENGQYVEFLSSIQGWSCDSALSSQFSSVQKDNKGREKRLIRDASWDWNANTMWQGLPSTKLNFEHNKNNTSPKISVYLRETCSKTEMEMRTETNLDGETETKLVPVTKTVYKNWTCSIEEREFPANPGAYISGSCNESSSSFHDWDLSSYLISSLRNKEITFSLEFIGSQQSFIELNSPRQINGESEEFIFNISQGLGGGFFDNNFSLNIEVDGLEHEHKTSTGLINEDFRIYVPKGQNSINIKLAGAEKDLISDDIYKAFSEINLYKNSTTDRLVTLTSEGLLGQGSRSMMRVKLLEGPVLRYNSNASESIRSAIDSQKQKLQDQQSLVAAQLENIRGIRNELSRAEGNYELAQTISIPVSIAGAGLMAFGAYSMWTGEGIGTQEILTTAGGAALIAASGAAIVLTHNQVEKLLEKLEAVEQEFQSTFEAVQKRLLAIEGAQRKQLQ